MHFACENLDFGSLVIVLPAGYLSQVEVRQCIAWPGDSKIQG